MPSVHDIFAAGNEADYAPSAAAASTPAPSAGGDAYDQYGQSITNKLIEQKRAEGPYTLDEAFKDIDTGNAAAERLRATQINREADLKQQWALKMQDVNKATIQAGQTQPLTKDDQNKVNDIAFITDRLHNYADLWQNAHKAAGSGMVNQPSFGSAGGGTVSKWVPKPWQDKDRAAFDTATDSLLTSIATGLVGDTAGAGGRPGTQELMKGMLPNESDSPDRFQAKMNTLFDMTDAQAHTLVANLSSKNRFGNPQFDTTGAESLLQENLARYNGKQQQRMQNQGQQAPGGNTTVFNPADQAIVTKLNNSANQGNQAPQIPIVPPGPQKNQANAPQQGAAPIAQMPPSTFAPWR